MALRILLADFDEEWLEKAKVFFKENSYDVDVVETGKDIQLALYNTKYFAIIMNYEIKNHSGNQVLRFIRTNYPGQRVVVIFDSETLVEELKMNDDRMQKEGITEKIVRPFSNDKLALMLEGHQGISDIMSHIEVREGASDEVEVSDDDETFTKVKIDEFFSAKAVIFDLFVKLGTNKYIKILHSGDTFDQDRLTKYKDEKKMDYLYFKSKDRRKYLQFTAHLANQLLNNSKISTGMKNTVLKNLSSKYTEEVFTEGLKPQVVEQGKEICQNVFDMVEKEKNLWKLLRELKEFDPSAFDHAYLVTLFASAIIKQFEWQSRATIEATALACMLHDIGKTKLPKDLLEKRPKDMNDAELAQYKTHAILGAEIVESNRQVPNSVKQIIAQHHEYFDGSGFPHGFKGSKILLLANIVCIANDFSHVIIDNDLSPTDALKKMITDREVVQRYNSKIVENFIKVFVDPGKIVKERSSNVREGSHVVPHKKVS